MIISTSLLLLLFGEDKAIANAVSEEIRMMEQQMIILHKQKVHCFHS